jgi:hypothetical protein
MAFAAGLSLLAGCTVRAGEPPTATIAPRQPCIIAVFPGAPPFAVDDMGPIEASCPSSMRRWSTCGIDQANLLDVACSSGADTVFGLYEVLTPAQGLFSAGGRVMHARLGRRRTEIGTKDQTGNRLE